MQGYEFLMGKAYWEFVIDDEKEPPFLKKPSHNNKFKPTKLGIKMLGKSCISFPINVCNLMIVHIQDVKSPKQA